MTVGRLGGPVGGDRPWHERDVAGGLNWRDDGLLNLLAVRSRANLAAAFAERTWSQQPLAPHDWDRVANTTYRILSLYIQAEKSVNHRSDTELPPYEISAGGRTPRMTFSLPAKTFGTLKAGAGRTLVLHRDSDDCHVTLTLRVRQQDAKREYFKLFQTAVLEELITQLLWPTTIADLGGRTTTSTLPLTDADERWDLRVRFMDFMNRSLLYFRQAGARLHPFMVFTLQPQRVSVAEDGQPQRVSIAEDGHTRSGLFGYSYVIDEGQRKFIGPDKIRVLEQERVRFPSGLCSQVYLKGRMADPHDAADFVAESEGPLHELEAVLLADSTLMEIPVFGTPWMYDDDAPDGPEFVLCIALPNTAGSNQQAGSVEGNQRIAAALEPPANSSFRPAEAQVLREIGQKLLSQYAVVAPKRLPKILAPVLAAAPNTAQIDSFTSTAEMAGILSGSSGAVKELHTLLVQVAPRTGSVLILGPSGTGKERVAEGLHSLSPRRDKPWVATNCAAEELTESHFFGHVKGAFTDAVTEKKGIFELAEGGTLFLDEICEMPLGRQAKLLRVLQEREVWRLGATTPVKVNVRVVAATNRDILHEIQQGRFKEDLFYRLNVVPIQIPSLADRPEDVRPLINDLIADLDREDPGLKTRLDADAMELLAEQNWPGNARELRNHLERLRIPFQGHITAELVRRTARLVVLSPSRKSPSTVHGGRPQVETVDLKASLAEFLWSYPTTEGEPARASWAVKESAVLKGELGRARDEPGLGVAIVTTELATAVFGSVAEPHVDGCISWAAARAENSEPYRILARDRKTIDDLQAPPQVDLRHTFAWAVILARSGRYRSYVKSHLNLVLGTQAREHGGWPEQDAAATLSAVFTALYAVEFLHLVETDHDLLAADERHAAASAKASGIGWLMNQRHQGLWSSGVLAEFAWDRVHATAWTLHRLLHTADAPVDGWRNCLDEALFMMLQQARNDGTWVGSPRDQRHRVEARIAAAAHRCKAQEWVSGRTRDTADLYLRVWRPSAEKWVRALDLARQMDIATAAFLIGGMVPPAGLADFGRSTVATS